MDHIYPDAIPQTRVTLEWGYRACMVNPDHWHFSPLLKAVTALPIDHEKTPPED